MPNTAKARIFRSTQTSPNATTVRDLTTAFGAAANSASTAPFALAGASGYRFDPTVAGTAANPPAGPNSTAAGMGWRDTVGDNANEPITYAAGTWTAKLRVNKTVMTINASVTVRVTAVVYKVSSAGTHIAEIGRIVMADTALPTVGAVVDLTGSFTTGSATTFAAGNKVQVEVYIENIVAGLPAAAVAAYTVAFVIDEASANGANFTAIPAYTVQFARSHTTVTTATLAVARPASLFRTHATSALSASALAKRVTLLAKAATVLGTTATAKQVAPTPKAAAVSGVLAAARRVGVVRAATVLGTPAMARRVTAARAFAATVTGTPGYARAVAYARQLAASGLGTPAMVKVLSAKRSATATVLGTPATVKSVGLVAKSATVTGTATFARAVTAARSFATSVLGTPGFARALIFGRVAQTTTTTAVSGRIDAPITALNRIAVAATPDWPLNTPTKAIAGVTRNSAGAVVVSATVKLVRQSDDVRVATTTSHATTGAYSFTRGGDDPNTYYVIAFKADVPEVHGISDRGLVPV